MGWVGAPAVQVRSTFRPDGARVQRRHEDLAEIVNRVAVLCLEGGIRADRVCVLTDGIVDGSLGGLCSGGEESEGQAQRGRPLRGGRGHALSGRTEDRVTDTTLMAEWSVATGRWQRLCRRPAVTARRRAPGGAPIHVLDLVLPYYRYPYY